MKTILEAIKERRSIYSFGNNDSIDSEKIISLVQDVAKNIPSAFNMQSQRLLLLMGKSHHQFWDIVLNTLKNIVNPEQFKNSENKIKTSFDSGFGIILYFEDNTVVESMGNQFPSYKENFKSWSIQGNAMLQYALWTTLASEGYGASLQHYNPIIDVEVKKTWNIPESWSLIAQMPFGISNDTLSEKEFMPIDDKVKIYK